MGLSHVSVRHMRWYNAKHTCNSAWACINTHTPQINRAEGLDPIGGYFCPIMSAECNYPRKQPQQGGTIKDISSGFPLWTLLFPSPPITCTTGGLLCGITRANGATHFCCRKSDSRAVTAKTVIKKPKLHHDVGHFSREGKKVLQKKRMGLLTSYGMCKLVLWRLKPHFLGLLWKNKTLK